jgi:hypothetical protein
MNNNNSIQATMFRDLESKSAYELAKPADSTTLIMLWKEMFFQPKRPCRTSQSLKKKFPEWSTPAKEVIRLLHIYGSPATVSQIGGRYFGFVDGSAVPAEWLQNYSPFWDQNTAVGCDVAHLVKAGMHC